MKKLKIPNSDLGTSIGAISCQKSKIESYLQNLFETVPSGYSPPATYKLFLPETTTPCLLQN